MPAFEAIVVESGTNPKVTLTFKNADKTDRDVSLAVVTFTAYTSDQTSGQRQPLFEAVDAAPGPKSNQKIVSLTEEDTANEGAYYTEIVIDDEGEIEKWRGSLRITGQTYG